MAFDPNTATPLGEFDPTTAKPYASSTMRRIGDLGLGLAQGVIQAPAALVGLADIPTGGRVGKLLEDTVGYRPNAASNILETLKTPELQAAKQKVSAAEQQAVDETKAAGGGKVRQIAAALPAVAKAAIENPSTIVDATLQSIPSTVAGGAVGRAALKVLPKISGAAAGAIGEGAVSAGQNVAQVREEEPSGTLTPEQSGILAASGAVTGLITHGAGKVAEGSGIGFLPTMLATGKTASGTKGVARRIAQGALTEGLLEEFPQSAQEQIAQNLAQGKPWNEGVAQQAVMGAFAGGAMGAGSNLLYHQMPDGRAAADVDVTEDKAPELVSSKDVPMLALPDKRAFIVAPDGTTFKSQDAFQKAWDDADASTRGGWMGLTAPADVEAPAPAIAANVPFQYQPEVQGQQRELERDLQPAPAPEETPAIALPGEGQPAAGPIIAPTTSTGEQYVDALAKSQRGELLNTYERTLLANPPEGPKIVVPESPRIRDTGPISRVVNTGLESGALDTKTPFAFGSEKAAQQAAADIGDRAAIPHPTQAGKFAVVSTQEATLQAVRDAATTMRTASTEETKAATSALDEASKAAEKAGNSRVDIMRAIEGAPHARAVENPAAATAGAKPGAGAAPVVGNGVPVQATAGTEAAAGAQQAAAAAANVAAAGVSKNSSTKEITNASAVRGNPRSADRAGATGAGSENVGGKNLQQQAEKGTEAGDAVQRQQAELEDFTTKKGEVKTFTSKRRAEGFKAMGINKVPSNFTARKVGSDWLLSRPLRDRSDAQLKNDERLRREKAAPKVVATDSAATVIGKAGGIKASELLRDGEDIESIRALRSGVVGKPAYRTNGGMSLDAAAEVLDQHGFDVRDENGHIDATKAREIIASEINGEPVHSAEGQAIHAARDAEMRARMEAETSPPDVKKSGYHDLSHEARASLDDVFDEDAFAAAFDGRGKVLSREEADREFGFVEGESAEGARETTEGGAPQGVRRGQEAVRGPPKEEGGALNPKEAPEKSGVSTSGPELELKGETEAEIRDREARQAKDAEAKKKREAAPASSDFKLTGSDSDVDEARAKGQNELLEPVARYGKSEVFAVPAAQGRAGFAVESPGGQLDLFAAGPVPQGGAKPAGVIYSAVVEPAKVGEVRLGFDRIDTPEKAAHAFAALRKSPRERFNVLVVDKNDRPLAYLDLHAGGVSSTSVNPGIITAAVYQTDGAAGIWLAHNHPSGEPTPSAQDRSLTALLKRNFGRGTGIEYKGHVIIAGTKATELEGQPFDIPAAARSKTVPVTERVVRRPGKLSAEAITSPRAAREALEKFAGETPGVLALDSQNRPLGFFPLPLEQMNALREDGRYPSLMKSLARMGSVRAAMYYAPGVHNDMQSGALAVDNLGTALANNEIGLLDAFVGGENGAMTSFAERGLPRGTEGGVFFSRAGTAAGSRAENVRSWIDGATKKLAAPVQIEPTVEAARKATGLDISADTDGIAHGNGILLIAENIGSALQAETTLFHEVFHIGLRRTFGRDIEGYNTALNTLAGANSGLRAQAAEWTKRFGADARTAYQDAGLTPVQAREATSVLAIEEALADLSGAQGEKLQLRGMKQFVAAIQKWLRGLGFKELANWMESATNAEAVSFIARARDSVQIGEKSARMPSLQPAYHRAYHGSPHDFERFDISKIGSGEGAQAYGHGLYFAGRKEVAEYYRDSLGGVTHSSAYVSQPETRAKLETFGRYIVKHAAELISHTTDAQKRTSSRPSVADVFGHVAAMRFGMNYHSLFLHDVVRLTDHGESVSDAVGKVLSGKRSRLYEVELAPKESDYLVLDKPLSEQSEDVKSALRGLGIDVSDRVNKMTGEDAYRQLATMAGEKGFPNNVGASNALAKAGVPGLKYLDALSRHGGAEPSYNYVIFDSKHVAITAKYHRTTMPDWVQNGSTALKSAAAKIDTYAPQKTITEKVKGLSANWKERLIQRAIDAYAPLKRLGPREYMLARMVKAGDGALEGMMLYGKPKMNADGSIAGELDKKGFLGAMQDLQGEHDRFLMWVAGNRSQRLMDEGREHLFTASEIKAMTELNQGKMKDGASRLIAYGKAAETLSAYNKAVLDIAEKTGLIDGDARHLWEHDFYVPFFRVDEDAKIDGPSKVKGLVRQQAFQKLKGGEEPLGDLLENSLRNWSHLITASLANQAAVASLKAAEKVGIAREVPSGTKGATFAMVDGQKVHYAVSDPFMLTAISAMEAAPFKGVPMKVLGAFKHALTLGVTTSPPFRIRNLMRDTLTALGTTSISANPVANIMEGYKATDRKGEDYAQALFSGAMMRFGYLTDGKHAEHAKRLILSGVKDQTILDTPTKVKDALGKVWDEWQEFGDRMENVNRLALYKQKLKEGKSPLEAAFEARDMMDFSLQGSSTAVRFLTQVVPFFNARLQGLYKLGRAAQQDPARFGYVVGATTLASIALMLAYGGDDDWKKREDWDRDNFWWFKLGDVAYRIPKPFEIGAMATVAERGLELMISDEMTGKRFAQRMQSIVGDQLSMNPTPQFFKPMLDIYANTDSFTNRQIETKGMENLSKPERAQPNTSLVAKALGKAGDVTNLSPVQIDQLIRGYFGWVGTHIVDTVDLMAQPFMADKPARKLDDYMVVGDFVRELPSNRSRYLEDFYKQAKDVAETMGDIRHARELGEFDKVRQLLTDNRDKVALAQMYTAAERRISIVNKRLLQIQASPDMSAADKRTEVDRLMTMRNELAKKVQDRATARRAAAAPS